VCLRPKRTGRLFLAGDLDFLDRAAGLAGRRLEQMQLTRTAAGERQRRRQLDELSRLKDDFLSRVAHDLRTPVTSLGWSIRNLGDGLAGELNEKQKEYLYSIRDAVDHLAGLVDNLLEISRLEKSKVEVICVPLNPERSISRAVGTVKPLAEAQGVALVASASGQGAVLADEDKLTEVLVNLLENAVRFSPRTGTVEVTTEDLDGSRIRIAVRDQGPGLKGLADPFGRFVQGAPSPAGERGGYGLGLTIAREYVVLMGGTIRGDDHPTGGAIFTIELKRCPDQGGSPS
jgi:signal transduction histidine kinase